MTTHFKFASLLICLLFLNSFAVSQYVPLPDSLSSWSSLVWVGGVPDHAETTTLQGDTVVNNLLYQKAQLSGMLHGGTFLIREDSLKRVYVQQTNPPSADQLLCQFGLQIGDTVTTAPLWTTDPETFWVTTVDTIQIYNGDMRRRMRMESATSNSWNPEYWIEGVGSSRGLLNAGSFIWDFDAHLLCQFVDSAQEFAGDLFATYGCSPVITSSVDAETEDWDLQVWPQPASGPLRIDATVPAQSEYALHIFDVFGKRIHEFGQQTGSTRLLFPAEGIPPGIYFLRMESSGFVLTQRVVWQ